MGCARWIASTLLTAGVLAHGGLLLAQAPSADAARTSLPTAFPIPPNTQPTPQGITPPEAALAALRLPPQFRATLFAAEPDVRQPIALATDTRGRLWVAENYTYSDRETNFDLRLRDRITILEDRDRDGRYDKRTVFWDQASQLTSVEVGFGGVWALCPPYLLFLPDRNGDDVLDSEPEIVLDGWNNDTIRHNIANGLRWGPDGWLYGRHGITTTSFVGAPGASADQRTAINCGIWRYHPVRRTFDVVCHGTTNPWGMDWDEHGQLFFINTVIGHLWHVVPGAHFQRMFGEDFRPHLYELLPQTADHFHWDTVEKWSDIRNTGVTPSTDRAGGGHAHCGMMIYQGGIWPSRYHNTVFTVNLHGHRLNNDRLERRGASYIATHAPDFLTTDDPWFRGVEVTASPHGDMYLADWSDIGECHENDGVHRSTGRIYQITYAPQADGTAATQASRTGEAGSDTIVPDGGAHAALNSWLVAAQQHRNEWLVRQARMVLYERAVAGQDMTRVHAELLRMFEQHKSPRHALRAMWALYVTGGVSEDWLVSQLAHASEHVRCWSVQLLCDQGRPAPSVLSALCELAERESSGLVLCYLASALRRLEAAERLALAERIGGHAEFAGDPILPLLVWHGLEPAVPQLPAQAVAATRTLQFPKTREYVARRVTAELERQPEAFAALVAAARDAHRPAQQRDYLRGMAAGLRGWRRATPPPAWSEFVRDIESQGDTELVSLARELSVVFGDGRAVDELREVAANSAADLASRRAALRALTAAKVPGINELLRKIIGERDLQTDAIRGLAACGDAATPQFLVDQYRRLYPTAQPDAITTLASRPEYAQVLFEAIARGRIDRTVVTPFHLRQIQTFGDAVLNERITQLWPELQQLSQAKSGRIAQLRDELTPERLATANLANGKMLFDRSCANCHVLFGQGGKIGPDLTGAQRSNLQYLLENIIDPSATVTENFRMAIVLVADGRVLNGILAEQTDKTVTVVTPTERIALSRDEIEEIRPANISIMPEGQLDVLHRDQVRDLIGFLMQSR
ncbi:MAG: PVC-type heme-binding CxxCH protein [Pirellulaceae bacterium]